jgi:integrase
MKQRYRLFRRRGEVFYSFDNITGKQHSLKTNDESEARRLHNFALDMNWLPTPIFPRRQRPKIQFATNRGITFEEHQKLLAGEQNPEWKSYYGLLWQLGGSQSDIASLKAEDIDWAAQTLSYGRM